MRYALTVDGGRRVRLGDVPTTPLERVAKDEAVERTHRLGVRLGELQDLLFYAGRHALLVILQGRDTSGKDGAIRAILERVNTQSCRVEAFKVPTVEEAAHDFLWRVHARTPRHGSVAIFNRSHYEDVLVPRVHGLVPKSQWRRRYDAINAFEATLGDARTLVVKIYLHIDAREQKRRLLERERETEKAWKLSVADWKERELWDEYTHAYEELLWRCSSPALPWVIVPANKKWYRNLAVMDALVRKLEPFEAEWMDALRDVGRRSLQAIRAYRRRRRG